MLHSYFSYLQTLCPVTVLQQELMQLLHSDLPLPIVKMFLSIWVKCHFLFILNNSEELQ